MLLSLHLSVAYAAGQLAASPAARATDTARHELTTGTMVPASGAKLRRQPRYAGGQLSCRESTVVERKSRKRINLALQGGGAHGAFTWGVLDRLLEDGRLDIAGICGTSAGAMNGVALAYGLARGGPAEARATLARFWGRRRRARPLQPGAADAARPGDLGRRHGLLAGLADLRCAVAHGVALRRESGQHQSAGRGAGRGGRFRLAARAPHRSALRLRHQRQDRQDPRVRLQRDLGQGDHGLRLPAVPSTRRSRSTARATGTAASWATRRCSRSSTTPTARTC